MRSQATYKAYLAALSEMGLRGYKMPVDVGDGLATVAVDLCIVRERQLVARPTDPIDGVHKRLVQRLANGDVLPKPAILLAADVVCASGKEGVIEPARSHPSHHAWIYIAS